MCRSRAAIPLRRTGFVASVEKRKLRKEAFCISSFLIFIDFIIFFWFWLNKGRWEKHFFLWFLSHSFDFGWICCIGGKAESFFSLIFSTGGTAKKWCYAIFLLYLLYHNLICCISRTTEAEKDVCVEISSYRICTSLPIWWYQILMHICTGLQSWWYLYINAYLHWFTDLMILDINAYLHWMLDALLKWTTFSSKFKWATFVALLMYFRASPHFCIYTFFSTNKKQRFPKSKKISWKNELNLLQLPLKGWQEDYFNF